MTSETPGGTGYFCRILAAGARPFRYRSRVWSLLGVPPRTGVEMHFPQGLPIAGFSYLRQHFTEGTGFADELVTGAAREPARTPAAPSHVRALAPQPDIAMPRAEPAAKSHAPPPSITALPQPSRPIAQRKEPIHSSPAARSAEVQPPQTERPAIVEKAAPSRPVERQAAHTLKGPDVFVPGEATQSRAHKGEQTPGTPAQQPDPKPPRTFHDPMPSRTESASEMSAGKPAPAAIGATASTHPPRSAHPAAASVPAVELPPEPKAGVPEPRKFRVEPRPPLAERTVARAAPPPAAGFPSLAPERGTPVDRSPSPLPGPLPATEADEMPFARRTRRRTESRPPHATESAESTAPPASQQAPKVIVVHQAATAPPATLAFWERRHLMHARTRILR